MQSGCVQCSSTAVVTAAASVTKMPLMIASRNHDQKCDIVLLSQPRPAGCHPNPSWYRANVGRPSVWYRWYR